MIELKVRDVVRCVDDTAHNTQKMPFKKGGEYTVSFAVSSYTVGFAEFGDTKAEWFQDRFQLLRRPVSADSPLVVGWYGLLRDGRRTDGAIRKNDTASGVDFPFCCEVDGDTTVRCADGTYWHHRQKSPLDITHIIPPEAVEQEKADEGPRYEKPPHCGNIEWLGRWGDFDLWYEDEEAFAVYREHVERIETRWPTQASWFPEAIRRAKARGLIADDKPDIHQQLQQAEQAVVSWAKAVDAIRPFAERQRRLIRWRNGEYSQDGMTRRDWELLANEYDEYVKFLEGKLRTKPPVDPRIAELEAKLREMQFTVDNHDTAREEVNKTNRELLNQLTKLEDKNKQLTKSLHEMLLRNQYLEDHERRIQESIRALRQLYELFIPENIRKMLEEAILPILPKSKEDLNA